MDKSKVIDCYRTYAFYEKGQRRPRRLSIFAKLVPQAGKAHILEITVIPCSLKDNFNKATAQRLYRMIQSMETLTDKEHLPKHDSYIILCPITEKPRKVFLEHCKQQYLRKLVTRDKVIKETVKFI